MVLALSRIQISVSWRHYRRTGAALPAGRTARTGRCTEKRRDPWHKASGPTLVDVMSSLGLDPSSLVVYVSVCFEKLRKRESLSCALECARRK